MTEAGGWFVGGEPRSEDESRFLAEVRRSAEIGGLEDVPAEATSVLTLGGDFVPMLLQLDVPGLPSDFANLQVGYFPPGWTGEARLVGEWGDKYLLDGFGSPQDLSVAGVDMPPEQLAEFAIRWLREQLRRPVDAHEWTRDGIVVATEWRFPDTGRFLATDGVWFRRFRRLEPRCRRVR